MNYDQNRESVNALALEEERICTEILKRLERQKDSGSAVKRSAAKTQNEETLTINLMELLFFILSKAHYVLLGAVFGAALMACMVLFVIAPQYTATSKLYIVGQTGTSFMTDLQIGTALTMDYSEVFQTWEVHQMVNERLGTDYSYTELQKMLSVENPKSTRLLYISVRHSDPQRAADIANAYAFAAQEFIAKMMVTDEPSVFSTALVPSVPTGTSTTSRILMGFLMGTMCVVGVLVLYFALDKRPKTSAEVAKYSGAPTLSVIPARSQGAPHACGEGRREDAELKITRLEQPDYARDEAFNTLCTNLFYCGDNIRTILFTSRYENEGKSNVSINVMRTLGHCGKRVVLVDADLRCSDMASRYGFEIQGDRKAYGLAQFLAGMCSLEEAIYETDIPHASIIPAGREVLSSLCLLTSPRYGQMMAWLKENFDVVLVDTPPAGMIADALEIAKYCDGAILVVAHNTGRRQEIGEVAVSMERTGCKVLGSVLNDVDMESFANRHYYYRSGRYASYYRFGKE